jgi:hypothetical protein
VHVEMITDGAEDAENRVTIQPRSNRRDR